MENEMKIRVTYLSPKGTSYSEIEDYDSDEIEIGEWFVPFPNQEGNSTAFGFVECLMQSDYCPLALYEEGIMAVKIEKI